NLPRDGIFRGYQYRSDCSQDGIFNGRESNLVDVPMQKMHYECDFHTYPYTTLEFEASGTMLDLFGRVSMRQASPSSVNWDWRDTSDLRCFDVTGKVEVKGDVSIRLTACQPIDVQVRLKVVGDESGRVYGPGSLGLGGFDWVVSDTPGCGNELAWTAGRRAVLRAQAPVVGLEFIDWTHVDNLEAFELFTEQDPQDPRVPLAVHVRATDTEPSMKIGLEFAVHCAELKVGAAEGIIAPAPNC